METELENKLLWSVRRRGLKSKHVCGIFVFSLTKCSRQRSKYFGFNQECTLLQGTGADRDVVCLIIILGTECKYKSLANVSNQHRQPWNLQWISESTFELCW